jgi:hypothetical protein
LALYRARKPAVTSSISRLFTRAVAAPIKRLRHQVSRNVEIEFCRTPQADNLAEDLWETYCKTCATARERC